MRQDIILILLTLTFSVNAQFKPVVTNMSESWKLKHEIFDGAEITQITIDSIVSIDSMNYYRVYDSWTGPLGYLRSDSTNSRLWFRNLDSTYDLLIMDMNLEVGDSFNLNMSSSYILEQRDKIKVERVDTINGNKTITFDYHIGGGFISEQFSFIEGVGPNASVLYSLEGESAQTFLMGYMVCNKFVDNDITYSWNVGDPNDCGRTVETNEFPNFESQIRIFPNPTSSNITVSSLEDLRFKIVFFNLQGIKVYEEDVRSSTRIDINSISTQNLFYRIETKANSIVTGKLINVH